MANRNFIQFNYSLEKKKVSLFATVLMNGTTVNPTLRQWTTEPFGSAGAYSAAAASGFRGIGGGNSYPSITVPIVYNSAGNYTVYFQDRYVRLLNFQCTFLTTAVPSCPFVSVPSASINLVPTLPTTCPSLVLQYFNSAGVVTSPTAAEVHLWRFDFSDSSAP